MTLALVLEIFGRLVVSYLPHTAGLSSSIFSVQPRLASWQTKQATKFMNSTITEQLNILTCFAVLTFTNYFIVPSASAVEHGDHSSW